jgi:hypothetical protein
MYRLSIRVYVWAGVAALSLVLAAPAHAQYRPRTLSEPATGEKYHIEVEADVWMPTAEMTVASASLGILGDQINLKTDLGMTDQRFPSLSLQLRPARSHKLRVNYVPIRYDGNTTLTRSVVFNGQRYPLGAVAVSSLDWKAYRFSYEYDFVTRDRGFVGFIIEAKYTDVRVQLDAISARGQISEFAHARAPIPALGGIARVYVVPNISITGEFTGFKIPDSIDGRYNAHYIDLDVYGTLNFTNNIGVKGGYRLLDLGYLIKTDSGSFVLKGLYFGAVLRF